MSDDQYDPELVAFVQQILSEQYIDVAMFALLVYEYAVTFRREVAFVWKRKITSASILFLVNRYVALVYGVILVLADNVDTNMGCRRIVRVYQALSLTLTIVFALFSGLRVYALWDRNIYLCVLIITLNLIPVATNLYLFTQLVLFASDLYFSIVCLSYNPTAAVTSLQLSNTTRISVILAEFLVFILTAIKTVGIKREAAKVNMRVDLTTLLIRDGSIYFFVLFTLNTVQIILVRITDVSGYISPSFIGILTPILISRFMLDLRELNHTDNDASAVALSNFSGPHFIIPQSQNERSDGETYQLEDTLHSNGSPRTPSSTSRFGAEGQMEKLEKDEGEIQEVFLNESPV